MSTSVDPSECLPLIEACTLELYQRNIFRITGLPVDATSKEVARQGQKLQMLEEMGGGGDTALSPAAFPLSPPPTHEQIRQALARMKEPEHRLVDEFFWYWPETFGGSKNDPAIQALQAGEAQTAVDIWVERESAGSMVARHNLAIMFHMYAVDWTNHHVEHDIDEGRDEKIQDYWNQTISRWEVLAEADELWEPLKERVRSLADEALTTGFVRRMRRVLPQALDRLNAEAALKFAELGEMDWARFHVDVMRASNQGADDVDGTAAMVLEPTRRRVQQRLQAARDKVNKDPKTGVQVSAELMDHCRPLMELFHLFHGPESHHSNDLFDAVADNVLHSVADYQRATKDNRAFVDLLKQAMLFASNTDTRDWLLKNIAIGEGNLSNEQVDALITSANKILDDAVLTPGAKLQQLQSQILPQLPPLAQSMGADSAGYTRLLEAMAVRLRNIYVLAFNNQEDFPTAQTAIQIAVNLAVSTETRRLMQEDEMTLARSKHNFMCFFCGIQPAAQKSKMQVAMHGNVKQYYGRTEFNTASVPVSCCAGCLARHTWYDKFGCLTFLVCIISGSLVSQLLLQQKDGYVVGGFVGLIIGWVLSLILPALYTSRLKSVKQHPEVRRMRQNGWRVGARP